MKLTGILLLFMFYVQTAAAVTVVLCEDSEGERTFASTCPPGTTQVNAQEINTGTGSGNTQTPGDSVISATLYVVPECAICEEVRKYLESKNVSVTIKDASVEQAIQEELKQLTGVLRVPVVVIGDSTVTGFSPSQLDEALNAAGNVSP